MTIINGNIDPRNVEILQSAFDCTPNPILIFSIEEKKIVEVNKAALEVFDYSKEELTSLELYHLTPDITPEKLNREFERLIKKKERKITLKLLLRKKNNVVFPSKIFLSSFGEKNKNYILISIKDLTGEHSNEAELSAMDSRYHNIIETVQEGIWQTDENGITVFVNTYMALLLGYKPYEMLGKHAFDFIGEENISGALENLEERKKGLSRQHELGFITRYGLRVHTLIQSTPLFKEGKYSGSLSTVLDISPRKKAEEQLRTSEHKYRVLFEESPLAMMMLEYPSRKILAVNKGMMENFGYTKEEFESITIYDLRRPGEAYKSDEFYKKVSTEKHLKDRAWLLTKDKRERLFEVDLFEITFEEKTIYLGSVIDITHQEKAKEDLQQMNTQLRDLASHLQNIREEERTNMAREIHDELGQQLTALKMDISWLNKKLINDDKNIRTKINESLELIDVTINTVRKIAAELRPSILDDLGLAEAIDWQSKEFTRRTGIPVEFTTNVENMKFTPDISNNTFRIFQESLTNVARHANAAFIKCSLQKTDSHLTLIVADNGQGFIKEHRAQRKTLGLLGMKERIAMLNGKYNIESFPGKGTTVSVEVPLPKE